VRRNLNSQLHCASFAKNFAGIKESNKATDWTQSLQLELPRLLKFIFRWGNLMNALSAGELGEDWAVAMIHET
jgi:hypothetical protein